jgi:hypothetical protein
MLLRCEGIELPCLCWVRLGPAGILQEGQLHLRKLTSPADAGSAETCHKRPCSRKLVPVTGIPLHDRQQQRSPGSSGPHIRTERS